MFMEVVSMNTKRTTTVLILLALVGGLAACGGGGGYMTGELDPAELRNGVELANTSSLLFDRLEYRLGHPDGTWTPWVTKVLPEEGIPGHCAAVWSSDLYEHGEAPYTGGPYMHLILYATTVVDGEVWESVYERSDLLFGQHLLVVGVQALHYAGSRRVGP